MRVDFLKSFLAFVFSLCFFAISSSQERPLGTWKSFMPYGSSLTVCDAGGKVFSAAAKSIFSYEKATGIVQTYDKTNGLTDIDIKTMNYDPATNVLVIAYSNSNLDLMYNGTDVYNIPDIKNSVTTGALGINSISFHNGKAYVSTDMGISEMNLERKEIMNTYIIGASGAQVKVYASCIDGTNIYAATEEGVKHAPLSSSNLQDFNSWILFDSTQNLPKKKATYVTAFNGKVYTVISANNCDTLYEYNGTSWTIRFDSVRNAITSLNVVNGNLYFTVWDDNNTTAGINGKVDVSGNLSLQNSQGHVRPMAWFESNGISWESDLWNGLYKNNQGNIEKIVPDGPGTSNAHGLEIKDGVLRVAPGGVNEFWGYTFTSDGFFIMKDNKWVTRNQYTDPILTDVLDIITVATTPSGDKTYFGSFWAGLIEMDNNSGNLHRYDKLNSILEGDQGDLPRTKISSMTFDRNGNLWMANAGALRAIKLIKPDGTWKDFAVPYSIAAMKKIIVDRNDQLWAPLRRAGSGLLVWSYNQTLDEPSDDKSRLLLDGAGAGGLPHPTTYCIAEDKDGNIWVGTDQGIGIYYCPGNVFGSGGCDADQIKVERDGYIGYLFGTETVKAIAVDAANRKWIGTDNGLWLVSADGKKELLKFNETNSPLPDNQISDIVIDDETGEVYIATPGGLVSYMGDAIEECRDCNDAFVYPNPVKPDYDGPIAINGLTDNAHVKITDVAGTLIYEGKANGCQMIWDGKGYNGVRAKSGVYLVFSSTELGKERKVGKILLAN